MNPNIISLLVDGDSPQLAGMLKPFKREPGMSWGNPAGTKWLFAMLDGDPVGVVALSTMVDGSVRFKSDVVLPAYRGMGVYRMLCRERIRIAEDMLFSKATAFCGDMSIKQYLNDGFFIASVSAKGIRYVVKSL